MRGRERVVYERIKAALAAARRIRTQPLLIPAVTVRGDGRGDRDRAGAGRHSGARAGRGAAVAQHPRRAQRPNRWPAATASPRARGARRAPTSTPRACSNARSVNCWPAWPATVPCVPTVSSRSSDERAASRHGAHRARRPVCPTAARPGARSRCASSTRCSCAAMSAARLHRADWSGCARGTPDLAWRDGAPTERDDGPQLPVPALVLLLLLVLDPLRQPADLHPGSCAACRPNAGWVALREVMIAFAACSSSCVPGDAFLAPDAPVGSARSRVAGGVILAMVGA